MTASPPVDPAQAFLSASRLVADAGGSAVAYRRFGSGPPLVMLHGWPLWGFTFHRLLPLLEGAFDCIVPDLPGGGDTPWGSDTDFSIEGRARLVAGFIGALGLTEYWLLGQDTGATVARVAAAEHAAGVQGLILLNTEIPRHRPPWIPLYQRLLGLPGAPIFFKRLLRWRPFTSSSMAFGGCFDEKRMLDGAFREHNLLRLARNRRELQGQIHVLRAIDWRTVDELSRVHARIPCPTILIWGEDDPTFPIGEARRMAAEFARVELVPVPAAKLLVHEERPEDVAHAILTFVSGVER